MVTFRTADIFDVIFYENFYYFDAQPSRGNLILELIEFTMRNCRAL